MSPDLTPDCGKCAALCCVAFHFDEGPSFAYDKPAGEACKHLTDHTDCAIHDRLNMEGFSGCARFNCLGAGQRVVQEMFDGQNWQDMPRLLAPMSAAFLMMMRVHEKLHLLFLALQLPLTVPQRDACRALIIRLDPPDGLTRTDLQSAPLADALKEVGAFLASLRNTVSQPR